VPRRYVLVNPNSRLEDADVSVRPLSLAEFTGQRAARANLQVYIESAKARADALDHVLFVGPPGLGKFTLVGATTRAGLLTTPLRDRFSIPIRLEFYRRHAATLRDHTIWADPSWLHQLSAPAARLSDVSATRTKVDPSRVVRI
jgi:Holliday junction resolvasome RuvABC ATP-dependent DNA helicase subunit